MRTGSTTKSWTRVVKVGLPATSCPPQVVTATQKQALLKKMLLALSSPQLISQILWLWIVHLRRPQCSGCHRQTNAGTVNSFKLSLASPEKQIFPKRRCVRSWVLRKKWENVSKILKKSTFQITFQSANVLGSLNSYRNMGYSTQLFHYISLGHLMFNKLPLTYWYPSLGQLCHQSYSCCLFPSVNSGCWIVHGFFKNIYKKIGT